MERPLGKSLKETLQKIADTIRAFSIDAVAIARSGHAGTAMGCAEIGAYLYGHFLRYNPSQPNWVNRDRFILSCGHASILQYACLHLSGFSLTLNDLKRFRQLDSKTPSHPEYRKTEGVETTTGLDGQGIAHGIGQALGVKIVGKKFNRDSFSLYSGKVVVLAGDGCFMEGVSHEASALAGHLKLDNVIVIYDKNKTTLDGFVSESCSENTKQRYEAYGWSVYEVDGHNFEAIHAVFQKLRYCQNKPSLVIAETTIGKSAPTQAGSYLIHSEPLELEEEKGAKEKLGFPQKRFFIPQEVAAFFNQKKEGYKTHLKQWKEGFALWQKQYPELAKEYAAMGSIPEHLEEELTKIKLFKDISGREASGCILQRLAQLIPAMYGGSADLARSDKTHLHNYPSLTANDFSGRNIKYGVREFAMGTLAIGLAQTEKIIPFVGTFLAFSDYMLSAIRMAALMKLPIIYQLTHDSFFIGQDGPTHQPVEQLAHLRAIPNLNVIRPADANEVKMSWISALRYKGPTAIILSRQPLPTLKETDISYEKGLAKGGYVLKRETLPLSFTLLATGSEVSLALCVANELEKRKYGTRVVSMASWNLFDQQSEKYREETLGPISVMRVSIEAGSSQGWHKYVLNGKTISLDRFGSSAVSKDLAENFGFTMSDILQQLTSFKEKKRD